MPGNRQVQSNGVVSNSSVNHLEDAIQRLKIQTNDKQDRGEVADSGPYPDRPGEPDCIFYLRTGLCGYGSNCKFNHPTSPRQVNVYKGELPERAGQPDCGYYLKTGTCKFGSACKYHHPRDRHGAVPVLLNSLGLPMRQEEKPCLFYLKTGSCKFGASCKFDHPQLASAGTALAVPPPAAYGSPGLSVLPSSGPAYMGGFSKLPFSRTPYLPASGVQVPQTYMPGLMSPSIAPGYGWNTYMGGMRSVSSTGVLGSDLIYDSKNQGGLGMLHLLPDRPEQPECRQFMSNGSCKYGSDCKYHHPRERIAQLATNSLGPLMLPLRPGIPVCSYYSLYGLCKYGPTCKFDHPLPGYSYDYGLSYPTVFHPPLLPYQSNSPMLLSSDTSLSKSSKVPDRRRKPEADSNGKNQNIDTETPDGSLEQPSSPPNPSPASSELPQDQSD
ncbi:hypothetical protein RHMOL_Rhmol06G0233200 [Rhododendron molle]|uniref:Uncharacterized protein n=2 Tax=Rhododendron molle TaxID=49168 RepID=A0ACC0NGQ5_RHOML|nr:hypothetical protein RHMOL_Rhmol06G0233200 [Rhododendron molle]KAI8552036.1 hypothetical protein RHMOL_Rhmol06G0233200 [Rhododendron molle]